MKTSINKKTSRAFSRGVLNHVYQRTVNGFIIFYCISDYLVYFTILCVTARNYHVRLLMVSLMPDHIHLSVIAHNAKELSGFMCDLSKNFAYRHNITCHHKGSLFERPFGSAPKYGDKAVRTNLIYVGNNGPERHLAKKAENYRWSFLSYAENSYPFSEKLVLSKATKKMRRAIDEINATFKRGAPMNYVQMKRLSADLNKKEKEQMCDYIINIYNTIDYQEAARYFNGYKNMLTAMHSSTGSEYDINEVFIGKSDEYYAKMASVCIKELKLSDIHDVLALDLDSKMEVFKMLLSKTGAPSRQIESFLRVSLKKD